MSLTSLSGSELELLLKIFDERIVKKLAHFTLKGVRRKKKARCEAKNSSLYGSWEKLEFILVYLKTNMKQELLAYLYGMCQSKVSEWLTFLLPVVEESLQVLEVAPIYGDHYSHMNPENDYLAGDVVERAVPRKSAHSAQKEDYSGKKKKHTCKNFAICDEKRYIHFLSPSYAGSVQDMSIWKEMEVSTKGPNLLMDLGFQGAEKERIDIILPFKKPRGAELNRVQKQLNKAISSLRIVVEHAFSGVKRLQVIGGKIRLKGYDKREAVMRIAVALHNLRIINRSP